MRGRGYQANITLVLTVGAVIGTDGQQARILSLRTGVGLQADGVIASDFAKVTRQAVNQLLIAARLILWRKRMNQGELGPRDRDHLCCRVQFHRA